MYKRQILAYYNHKINGVPVKKEEMTSHDFNLIKKYHITLEDRMDKENLFFHDPRSLDLIKPVTWAKEKLISFKKQWYKIYVVTGRPEALREHTYAWINKHFEDIIDDIFFCSADIPSQKRLKSDVCKEVGSLMMVDDDARFAADVWNIGIKTYVINKPWNKTFEPNVDNIIKVDTWNEIEI